MYKLKHPTSRSITFKKGELYMDGFSQNWSQIPDDVKKDLIFELTSNLRLLRAKGNFTQEEVANSIGISRQTYNMIECEKSPMPWYVYLSLIFLFLSKEDTKKLLKMLSIFPNTYMALESEVSLNDS